MTTTLALTLWYLWLAPAWQWLDPATHNFGDLRQGEPASFDFRYVNTGVDSLWIDNVRVSCGCTYTDWTETPVAPGDTGVVHVVYDAADAGYFSKLIKVYFNGQRKAEKLYIEGYVE